jgi:NitT/TauT family transport system ATP-binding protein
MAVVEVEHLSKLFVRGRQRVEAIRDLSLQVADGEFVAIVGPSGCGKSTLLHILGGFVPSDGGTMRVDGRVVSAPGPDRGMMFQDLALFPWRTVEGNVGWALEAQGRPRTEREATVERYLGLVGLRAFRHAYPNELSGGMRQRVALARVLAFDPGVLLMDEPFGALDALTRDKMNLELQSIHAQAGATVVFVTHSISEAVFLADRVVLLTPRPGRIRSVTPVPLPRPRSLETETSAEFQTIVRELRHELDEE